jgi:hypothetical protein
VNGPEVLQEAVHRTLALWGCVCDPSHGGEEGLAEGNVVWWNSSFIEELTHAHIPGTVCTVHFSMLYLILWERYGSITIATIMAASCRGILISFMLLLNFISGHFHVFNP